MTHGNNTREIWTPDSHAMARPAKISVQNSSNTELWTTGTYAYDGAGNIKTVGTTSYTYDALQQLKSARDGSGTSFNATTFNYDPFGNYVASMKTFCNGAICGSTSALNRKYSTATNHATDDVYDESGNVTTDGARNFTYDSLGMMNTAAVSGRTFINLYTADEERVAIVEPKTVSGSVRNRTTWTLRGFDNQLLRSYVDDAWSGTRTITLREDEIWRGNRLLASTGSSVKHYALDHLGSPRLITSSTGTVLQRQTFAPYGAGGTIDGGMLQFTGHERDAANVADITNTPPTAATADLPDYLHARAYDAYQGRFLTVDRGKPDPKQPQSWNRYVYVMNNPMNRTDPSGNCSKPAGVNKDTVGICIEGFIAAKKLNGVGDGDNRTFAANDSTKTNREQVQLLVNTKTGVITAKTTAAVSTASVGPILLARGQGTASTTLSKATRQADGAITFSAQTTALNGLASLPGAPKDTIDYRFNFVVTSDGKVGLAAGGRTDGFPSIGAYAYESNGATVKLYEHSEHQVEDLAPPMEVSIPAVPPE